MVSLKDLRKAAKLRLEQTGNDSPLADIDYLLGSMGFDKSDIIRGEKQLDKQGEQAFWTAIKRLELGEPVQYITGKCEFMSLDFEVTPATLIPRADTEILTEAVIDLCKNIQSPTIFEIGTGSGCIAISLAHYIRGAKITSADISKSALEVAKRNAARNHAEVSFIHHNILEGFPKFEALPDIVVSNPPYIPSRDVLDLDKKVKDFEPTSALDGGKDGLDFYRFISKNAPINQGGYLAFEVGIDQSRDAAELMKPRFEDIKIIKDLAGIERVVIGRIKF